MGGIGPYHAISEPLVAHDSELIGFSVIRVFNGQSFR
jgi:hypothetical protein